MPNFVVLNEMSLPLSDHNWLDQVKAYKNTLDSLRSYGVNSVRVETHFKDLPEFTTTQTLQSLLGGISNRELTTRLKSLFLNQTNLYRSPLVVPEEEPEAHEELTVNSAYSYNTSPHSGGVACAAVWNTLALSFTTSAEWTDNSIPLEKETILEDDSNDPKVLITNILVPNISSSAHVDIHRDLIETLVTAPDSLEKMNDFCSQQNQHYPYRIDFTEKGMAHLKEIYSMKDATLICRFFELVKSIKANPNEGIGKPERLKNNWSGYSSRRVNGEHRIVYQITDENVVAFERCLRHYE
ncbi:Txe/YoeB family addiction module toxin [Vibrio parahaemolyticus]|uniref:Txe/YoeB family addiction module toxin n=1 Tax=Vibrio parahaemolyticus TaxID=670 RepID=UPI00111FA974|nr:Txe/YoeB family addiction module toxin [Vibrio parahaemolyticus]TOL15468.1 Txe/YoeB family addiction module toxin [Vibrio parahaemolyticus]